MACFTIDMPHGSILEGTSTCPRCGRRTQRGVLHVARDWLRLVWLPLIPLRMSAWSSCSSCSPCWYRVSLAKEGRAAAWECAQQEHTSYTGRYNNTFWASWVGSILCCVAGATLAVSAALMFGATSVATAIAGLAGWLVGGSFCRRRAAVSTGVDRKAQQGYLYGAAFWLLFPITVVYALGGQPLGVAVAAGVVGLVAFASFARYFAIDSLAARRLRRRLRKVLFC